MMYRPSAFMRSAKVFRNIATSAAKNIAEATGEEATALFVQLGIMAQAEREDRRRTRHARRYAWHQKAYSAGLNGKQAVARRQRQIAAGSLRVANGLVPE